VKFSDKLNISHLDHSFSSHIMLVLDKHNDTGLGDKGGQLFDERNLLKWSTFILAFTMGDLT
jgi:hypothetical protein